MDANRWLRINQAFDSLLDLSPAEQTERLRSLGSEDAELRAAVESLLAGDTIASAQLAPLEGALGTQLAAFDDSLGYTGKSFSHFKVHEPLGAGGMGIVYRAEDVRLERPVALKFLLPSQVNDAKAKERLLREARAVAALDHPNLCTVLEVGETPRGDLFIAMVLYPGETLKARLERQGALPVREAIRIAQQLSSGLAHAHDAGIIHGDLKPGNTMLLPDGTVKILDFGLARARDEKPSAVGGYRGTMPYMAPEQLDGRPVESRSDLWSLGVMIYEMLTGSKPFTGDNDARIAQAITRIEPTSISRVRPDVPAFVAELTHRLLQKDPAKRFDCAADVGKALRAASTTDAGREPRTRKRKALAAVAICGLIIGALSIFSPRVAAHDEDAPKLRLDDHLIVVPPFHVTANDSSVRLLRAGMMDLVSAKLTGSIRSVDARAVLNEWHRSGGGDSAEVERSGLLDIARHFAAGELLDGTVVETSPGNFEITGVLIDVSRPSRLTSASARGSRQNIGALVDSLVARLVAARYAEVDERATTLAETPFDALQAYLSGQVAFRTGQYLEAAHAFQRALQIDSSFALAAVRLDLAAAYSDPRLGAGAMAIARAHRDKLGVVERLIVETNPTFGGLDQLAVQQQAIQLAPEVPEFWFNLGENLAHWGSGMGFEDAQQRAIAAFERALALDSLFMPARHHLLFCYRLLGDTAGIRRVLPKLDLHSEQLSGNLWLATGNRADLLAFLRESPRNRMSPWLSTPALVLGRLDDLEWTAHYLDSTAATRTDRSYAVGFAHWLALDRGQPGRARRVLQNITLDLPPGPSGHELDPMMFTHGGELLKAMLWDVDDGEVEAVLPRVSVALDRTKPFGSGRDYDAWIIDVYAAAEYGILHGRPELARRALVRLSAVSESDSAATRRARHAGMLIDAQLAAMDGRPDAASLADVADSVLRRADAGSELFDGAGSLLIARVWEQLGNLPRAVAATARIGGLAPFYSSFVREHARLSALAGNREAAIKGYREYVLLRSKAEPSQLADLEAAKRELNRLTAKSVAVVPHAGR